MGEAKERGNSTDRREAVRLLDLSTIGMVFPIALLLGYFGGEYFGGLVGAASLGSWLGLGLGFLAGFYNLFKVVRMLERREERENVAGKGTGPAPPTGDSITTVAASSHGGASRSLGAEDSTMELAASELPPTGDGAEPSTRINRRPRERPEP